MLGVVLFLEIQDSKARGHMHLENVMHGLYLFVLEMMARRPTVIDTRYQLPPRFVCASLRMRNVSILLIVLNV